MKYERSILMRRNLDTFNFNPSYTSDLLPFPHYGQRKFHSEYDRQRYSSILNTVKALDISEDVWPYYNLEDDFYHYNSVGYRTYEFDNLPESFDIAIGCCCVEGLGLRKNETWVHHYEQITNRKVINLGKGGTGCNYINMNLSAWLLNYIHPKRIIIFWSDPSARTIVRKNGTFITLQYGNQRITSTEHDSDEKLNSWYNAELQDSTISSNEFILTYINTNLMLKHNNISAENFFPSIYWKREDVELVGNLTKTITHYIDYNNVKDGWAKFRDYQYFPGADMTHHGFQHQKPIAIQISNVYENT